MVKIDNIQPDELVDVRGFGFSHVTRATGGSQVYISGQVAVDDRGRTVGAGDLIAQTRQVMENLKHALASVEAGFSDVVKLTVYVVDYDPSRRGDVMAIRNEYIDANNAPASTLVGVQALAAPDYLIEIEAIAHIA